LYFIARGEELSSAVRKLGYALTRGTSAIEISGDVPHEITETEGKEISYITKKQGIDLLLHGSLTIPMCIPERSDWRDAHDHMQKSIRSAVFAGCNYVNFHACLNIWLELMTYAGRKLTMAFCDHEGHFISRILKENEKLRNWFVETRGSNPAMYLRDILNRDESSELEATNTIEFEKWRKEQTAKRLRALLQAELPPIVHIPEPTPRDVIINRLIDRALTTNTPPETHDLALNKKIVNLFDEIREDAIREHVNIQERNIKKIVSEKLKKGKDWDTEELRTITGILDGYHIMAHYLFYTKDPIWVEMAKMYKSVIDKYKRVKYEEKEYSYPDGEFWLDGAWKEAEDKNDREFKEFFYGVVGAKFLEGHIKKILEWMDNELIKKDLAGKKDLIDTAKKLMITIESPDARDPTHAGLHLLWSPRQLYAAVKTIRNTLKTDKVWLLMDFEHVATQGIDPIKEMEKIIKIADDYGKYVISVHANAPNPLHSHDPIDLGDVRIYELLWFLRKTGFGKDRKVYVIFERGGAEDPFKHSVDTLRLAVKFLEKDINPDELPLEYFGMKGPVAGDIIRQGQIIRDHAWEPLKDLLEMPEEEWTMLSQAVIKKGRKPEVWKKAEFR
jgi:endonuclease IV